MVASALLSFLRRSSALRAGACAVSCTAAAAFTQAACEDKKRGMFDLTGRTAMITGASRGIGYGIAVGMAQQGAHVVMCGVPPLIRDGSSA